MSFIFFALDISTVTGFVLAHHTVQDDLSGCSLGVIDIKTQDAL